MAKTLILLCSIFLVAKSEELLFQGFQSAATNITTNGVASIQQNGILRLTNSNNQLGHAFYSTPLKFKNSSDGAVFSFSTAFAFAITNRDPKHGGHGFAFTLSPSKDLPGAYSGQYLGLFKPHDVGNSSNHLFAVEFDTVLDYEIYDINNNHVGVNVNTIISNKSVPATDASSKQSLSLKSGKVIQAWLDYNSSEKQFHVRLSLTSSKPTSPILSCHLDLSPILHDNMYVGFSASTGLLASSHYILGWSFKMNHGEAKSLRLEELPSLPSYDNHKKATVLGVIVSSATLVMIVLTGLMVYVVRKMRNGDVIEPWELEVGPHRFSYEELKQATKGFREKQLIGFGGFGRVYKGVLQESNTEVAVKRITQDSKEGWRQFMSEIATIGRLRHRNIVQLRGWCRKRCDLFLVYDLMPNGSLDKYLFEQPRKILSWEERFKIIKGVAWGLVYLHQEWEQAVIHRDIKAGNVLLDSEMNGRLGDFGLAKMYGHGENPNTTRVVGTLGYLAPELTRTGKPTASSDVFAFGALLLEVACGRRPFEPKALPEELILVDWVRERWRVGRAWEVVDGNLGGVFDVGQALLVLRLGLLCSKDGPEERPSMRQVVMCLEGEMRFPDESCTTTFYDRVSTWSCSPEDVDASSLSLSGD
ncbi:L-type lectin-domain containing receptor kinase S.4 [Cajanus cajan]|uniref:L-type lectin-domain containing receptor kinase S.4 n=1 Tax=Cajanus cajan TaxID=3821 RepID=UPI00098DAAA4|nr:L-type lectin-domain containing receptor kinase S.4 [Cajanus cajan]